jgi:hypothetical protein
LRSSSRKFSGVITCETPRSCLDRGMA